MKKNDTSYKTIGEVAKILDLVNKKTGSINTHTIRFWEKEFTQIKPKIFAGKRRYYNIETIEMLKKIKSLLKDRGLTINGAKKALKNSDSLNLDEITNNPINTEKHKILKNKIKRISKLVKSMKKL